MGVPNFSIPFLSSPYSGFQNMTRIADQKAENHGSSMGSNTFSPFYFDVIILSCSTVTLCVLLPIGNFPNTCGSVIYRYGNFPNPLRVSYGDCIYTYSREHSYSLHLANGGMEKKDHVHLKLKS